MYRIENHINKDLLLKYAYENLGCNYFILLGLSISKMVYDKVYYLYKDHEAETNLEAILLKRKSGNLQLICRNSPCSDDVISDFNKIIQDMDFKQLITSKENIRALKASSLFANSQAGAFVSVTKSIETSTHGPSLKMELRPMTADDVPQVESLYKQVFESFTPAKVMVSKLESGRGRGLVLYEQDRLIAVAQTDFETSDGAIIVGVATAPHAQHRGYGHLVMTALCQGLVDEGKTLYLHYNSPIAGKLYDKMGFKNIDQIYHYKKCAD